ncbi:hypothetical protein CERZMDRAFT_51625 [Cercospora zeae-maydis SCOH1-5]|uniref:SPIN90/Ldb17 leucine-rich domain-containing protein n=1 Tax=Cercospora zeae-maydis SCOH1-5 TaxID=717836 RepID=A0A6A6EY89_9PEZI|nr:hypothetical protein CERZMDRAFT_51625 [Cercospora zeae-maydis SCOH1-5]
MGDESDSPTHRVENEAQFWADSPTTSLASSFSEDHEQIDDALRQYLEFTSQYRAEYLPTEYHIARCCWKLFDAELFKKNEDYVRRQILYSLLQEDETETLHLVAAILLFDGRATESTFELMQAEGTFQRLIELVRDKRDEDVGLHRLLLELLFEMSRIQKLSRADLKAVDDGFILYLFQLVEELSSDAEDPYHYPIIRVLLVLNEQYMCLANAPPSPGSTEHGMTNRILKLLSLHGPSYRTFGENLILLLNRETELGPQLLILKLLYLLFTTPGTYEYFYTNDLNVLVDVIIRNLLDLDESHDSDLAPDRDGQRALRHTYLRVLCPLLKNTQLSHEGQNYKREAVRRLLHLLINRTGAHFAPVDETVIRLVIRIKQIDWIRGEGDEIGEAEEDKLTEVEATHQSKSSVSSNGGDEVVAKKLLGMSLNEAGESSLSVSVSDVSAKVIKAKPTVPAPRRMRKTSKVSANGGATTQGAMVKDGQQQKLSEVTTNEGAESTQAAMIEPRPQRRPKMPPAPPKSKYGRKVTADSLKPVEVPHHIPQRSDSRSPFADENATT